MAYLLSRFGSLCVFDISACAGFVRSWVSVYVHIRSVGIVFSLLFFYIFWCYRCCDIQGYAFFMWESRCVLHMWGCMCTFKSNHCYVVFRHYRSFCCRLPASGYFNGVFFLVCTCAEESFGFASDMGLSLLLQFGLATLSFLSLCAALISFIISTLSLTTF